MEGGIQCQALNAARGMSRSGEQIHYTMMVLYSSAGALLHPRGLEHHHMLDTYSDLVKAYNSMHLGCVHPPHWCMRGMVSAGQSRHAQSSARLDLGWGA